MRDVEQDIEKLERDGYLLIAGDAVLFFSHIPHQGAKQVAEMERSNVVVHYQCTPMYEGAWHVSSPIGYQGTFPLAK